jgi:hypothetical protein
VALLVAGGRWLLRQWLLPVRKVKGPPSGAAPWQRVRTTSLPGSMNSPGDRRQPFPTTDAFLPAARDSIPSRGGGLVSHELLWAKMAGNVADAAVKSSSAILPSRLLAGLKIEDLARAVGKQPGAVRVSQFRALRALAEHLGLARRPGRKGKGERP